MHNLPVRLSTFIGREQEIGEVKRLLTSARLLTLTGAGGVGKTRLALRTAVDVLEQYPDGAWFVDLAPLADPAFVPTSVATALDIPGRATPSLIDTLAKYLRTRNLLLVLDNCEHLHAACQSLTDSLLRASATVRILATSREALGVEGEVTYRVPPLGLPDSHQSVSVAQLAECDAIRLFAERAALGQPGFTVTPGDAPAILQICQRLDGIPLAIEFAAARLKVLSVNQIAARLEDRFRLLTGESKKTVPRHQTLRATLDWSYELLSERERALVRRLSVFAGGSTLEAVEAVCATGDIASSDILDLLGRLVDKSLLLAEPRAGETRYRLSETVRQYAHEKLVEEGIADQLCRGHRDWYVALAEKAAPELHGSKSELWMERLEIEHDNLRAALEWSRQDPGGAEALLQLAAALERFWYCRGYWEEGLRWLEAALARSSGAPRSAVPKVLFGLAYIAWHRGDTARAVTLSEQGLLLSREIGDKESYALCLYVSTQAQFTDDLTIRNEALYERVKRQLEEVMVLSREVGIRWLSGLALAQLGWRAMHHGNYDRAKSIHAETLLLFQEIGGVWYIAYALRNLGYVALLQGDWDEAERLLQESLMFCRRAGDRWLSEECLEGLAVAASVKRDYPRAARLFGIAELWRELLGQSSTRFVRLRVPHLHDGQVKMTRSALGDVAFAAALAEGRAMTLEQAANYARATTEFKEPAGRRPRADRSTGDALTTREREIVRLVARGLTNRQIAQTLIVSGRTADAHVQNILNKLGFNTRSQIAVWAVERGLTADQEAETSAPSALPTKAHRAT